MCGRFVSASPPDQIAAYFDAALDETALAPNYNVAPTNDIYAVVLRPDGRHLTTFHWGLIPSWAKDAKVGMKMINARSETALAKNVFKTALTKGRRCLVPMDGFYEWRAPGPDGPVNAKGKPVKQPLFIHRADGEPLAVAGIWESWSPPEAAEGQRLYSATVFTTSANKDMAPIHDRMPVIIPARHWEAWLDPATDLERLSGLLVPAPKGLLAMHEVSTEVNNVRNKGPQLVEPQRAPTGG